jgi:lysozyme
MFQFIKLFIKFFFLKKESAQESIKTMFNSDIKNKDIIVSKNPAKCNQTGIDLIKRFEGFSSIPYLCQANKKTIGYGHVILKDEDYSHVTEEEAEDILKNDVSFAENAINKYITHYLTPNQFAALTSLVFNIGVGAFKKSSLRTAINNNRFDEAPYRFKLWNKFTNKEGKKQISQGLIKRRELEVKLWLS